MAPTSEEGTPIIELFEDPGPGYLVVSDDEYYPGVYRLKSYAHAHSWAEAEAQICRGRVILAEILKEFPGDE